MLGACWCTSVGARVCRVGAIGREGVQQLQGLVLWEGVAALQASAGIPLKHFCEGVHETTWALHALQKPRASALCLERGPEA